MSYGHAGEEPVEERSLVAALTSAPIAHAARKPTIDYAALCHVPHLGTAKKPTLAIATDLARLSVADLT